MDVEGIITQTEGDVQTEKVILIGLELVRILQETEKSLQGMILNTYLTSLMISTTSMYAGSSVFFSSNDYYAGYFFSCFCFSLAILSLMRLFYLTNTCEHLTATLKESLTALDQLRMEHDGTKWDAHNDWRRMSVKIKFLRKELKCHSDSPINPFSAFSLSNGALIGTFATILTYLIVLIQFKAAEK